MLQNAPDILSLKEMMKILHIGRNSALRLIHEGTITGHRICGKWLVTREDLEEYILRA